MGRQAMKYTVENFTLVARMAVAMLTQGVLLACKSIISDIPNKRRLGQ